MCAVAKTLRQYCGKTGTIGRIRDGSFVVFCTTGKCDIDLLGVASRLQSALSDQYQVGSAPISVTVSAGVFEGRCRNFDLDEALVAADLALSEAVKRGPSQVLCYVPEMRERLLRRQKLKTALAGAISRNEINVLYQPIVRALDGRIVAVEALARWHSDKFGFVPPDEFISLAEEMGLIGTLTAHVLDTAIADCMRWPKGVMVSVNLSGRDLDHDVFSIVANLLEKHDLAPERLEVEVTETALSQRTDQAIDQLKRLNAFGVGVALDDFGTGYSSFGHLRFLPVQRVKIDRSFVQNAHEDQQKQTILAGMIRLCLDLGKTITIEGVETEKECDLVRTIGGADKLQGYLFAKAMPANAIAELAARMAPLPHPPDFDDSSNPSSAVH